MARHMAEPYVLALIPSFLFSKKLRWAFTVGSAAGLPAVDFIEVDMLLLINARETERPNCA